jgi:hypothetical protein
MHEQENLSPGEAASNGQPYSRSTMSGNDVGLLRNSGRRPV